MQKWQTDMPRVLEFLRLSFSVILCSFLFYLSQIESYSLAILLYLSPNIYNPWILETKTVTVLKSNHLGMWSMGISHVLIIKFMDQVLCVAQSSRDGHCFKPQSNNLKKKTKRGGEKRGKGRKRKGGDGRGGEGREMERRGGEGRAGEWKGRVRSVWKLPEARLLAMAAGAGH